jgi:hypothetical protein
MFHTFDIEDIRTVEDEFSRKDVTLTNPNTNTSIREKDSTSVPDISDVDPCIISQMMIKRYHNKKNYNFS